MTLYKYLADAVVVLHAAYIAVVVFGLLAILLGAALRWKWVRDFYFRAVHLLMILIVVVQALLDVPCPLTTLEKDLLRESGQPVYTRSFIGHWTHELIFYDAPPSAFTVWYCLFGAVVLATLILAPPRWPWTRTQTRQEKGDQQKGDQQKGGEQNGET
jgi:hypothetical protein